MSLDLPRWWWVASALGLVSLAFTFRAQAQSATPVERFDPSPAGDALFAIPSAGVPGKLQPYGELALSYAHTPLVVTGDAGQGRSKVGNVVDEQLTLHALLAIDIARRLKVGLDLPVTLAQGGSALFLGTRTIAAPQGGALNDLRLDARGAVLRQAGAVPSVALGLSVFLPTGGDSSYTGAGVARFGAALLAGASYSTATYSVAFGTHQQKDSATSGDLLGSDLYTAAGVAYRSGALQIGPELFGSTVVRSNVSAFAKSTSNLEALLGVRYRVGDFVLGGAGGPGLASGAGTPSYRLIATFSYAPEAPSEENAESTTTESPSPPPPPPPPPAPPPAPPVTEPEKAPAEPPKPEPVDQDGDGIPDADDRCPTEPGITQTDPTKNGCPAAGKEPVVRTGAMDARGCPEPLAPTGLQSQLMEPVRFDYRKDELLGEDWPILRHALQVIQSHKEVEKFGIDGHTDDTGSEPINLGLSRLRAQVVFTWLVQHGVSAGRLEIRSFALYCPAVENTTDEGRGKNRRVEFRILK